MPGTSLIATMAHKANMDPAQFAKTIRATVMPTEHTEEQFAAFMMTAHQYGLNPITREIYAYPGREKRRHHAGGVDRRLDSPGQEPQGLQRLRVHRKPHWPTASSTSITCTIWRKDRDHPVVVTEHLSEC